MPDELNLTLPDRKSPKGGGGKLLVFLLLCVLAVASANLALGLLGKGNGAATTSSGSLSANNQKALALKLEKQGLNEQAAAAWEDYLATAKLDQRERASIWYRQGKLHQNGGMDAEALVAYYRSEALAGDEDWSPDLSRRIEECLENLGKFAALRYELAERVGLSEDDAAAGSEVVAEIGPQQITQADLDQRIETEIERQLNQFAAHLPEEDRRAQKEQLLKRLTGPQERIQFLNQVVVEELLYRKARELKLADLPEVRALIQDTERKILAQKVMERELSTQIKITPGDVETYYQANKQDYLRPERARLSHIQLDTEDAALEALKKIQDGEAFDAVCAEVSQDATTKDTGGQLAPWFEKGRPTAPFADTQAVWETAAGEVAQRPLQSDAGFHVVLVREREAQVQRSLEEAQQEVYTALRTRKEREVQERLLNELRETYNVVIHQSQFAPTGQDSPTQAGHGTQHP